ncbi:MAG: nucleotide-binding universal stress UspA family protein/AmiR [Cellvibrionaceae bacterium]|jgi:nucleotide-binding universal stress UspA family protein/AmiR/NasT family two-component response regulator
MQIDLQNDFDKNGSPAIHPIAVVLIEEHQKVRLALTQSLKLQAGIDLVEVLSYLPSRPQNLLDLKPDVILIGLPQYAVAEISTLTRHIQVWRKAGVAVIVLAPYLDSDVEALLLQVEVFAYIHKTINVENLKHIISTAHLFAQSQMIESASVSVEERRKIMFKRILVPVDGSELAEKALAEAQELAQHFQAELHFLRVYEREQVLADPLSPFDTYHLAMSVEDAKERAVAYLETVRTKLDDSGIAVHTHAVESMGKIGQAIAEQAHNAKIDLIVMTSHGYTGFRRLILGSVTSNTLHHAKCPVLVVPAVSND